MGPHVVSDFRLYGVCVILSVERTKLMGHFMEKDRDGRGDASLPAGREGCSDRQTVSKVVHRITNGYHPRHCPVLWKNICFGCAAIRSLLTVCACSCAFLYILFCKMALRLVFWQSPSFAKSGPGWVGRGPARQGRRHINDSIRPSRLGRTRPEKKSLKYQFPACAFASGCPCPGVWWLAVDGCCRSSPG